MPIVAVRIPQIGEGLQEARLVGVLKNPGDFVKRDEPIYQMETDKAVMDVESPFEGTLVEWLAPVDTILPIGGEVARMNVSEGTEAVEPVSAPNLANAAPAENLASVRIPQIGEGLQEARLVAVLKNPGDMVKRDEPIYQMETDKAVMDVESPYEGVLVEWSAEVDTVLAIGAEVAKMRIVGAAASAVGHGVVSTPAIPVPSVALSSSAGPTSLRNANMSPRTRAYAREKGIPDDQLLAIAPSGSKLTPDDIDAYLQGGTARVAAASVNESYEEQPMNPKQRLLSSRLVRSNQLVVPGTITVATNWEGIEALRNKYRDGGGEFQPSSFTMFAYAVAQALKEFPAFRSTLVGDSTVRTYHHANLGIAVALPGDELVIAVVEDADTLGWRAFADMTREKVNLARSGQDQATEATTISLTNMQSFGLRDAVPVVAAPSVATVFLGEVYRGLAQDTDSLEVRRYVNLAMTFDHRLINGVGASDFINKIKSNVEQIESMGLFEQ